MNRNTILSIVLIVVLVVAGFWFLRHSRSNQLSGNPDASTVANNGGCFIGGCSNEVCSDQAGAVSTCIYKPEFACYQKSKCERQTDGQCGWTNTTEFGICINNVQHPGADSK